jgi:hypothetical protein
MLQLVANGLQICDGRDFYHRRGGAQNFRLPQNWQTETKQPIANVLL